MDKIAEFVSSISDNMAIQEVNSYGGCFVVIIVVLLDNTSKLPRFG